MWRVTNIQPTDDGTRIVATIRCDTTHGFDYVCGATAACMQEKINAALMHKNHTASKMESECRTLRQSFGLEAAVEDVTC